MTEILSQRRLNRATLARQHLLERARLPVMDAIEHLGGMQAQAPLAPYVGLWTRLREFTPAQLSGPTEQRQVVRLHLMRNTLHLVSARDCLDWRALFYPLHAAQFNGHFRRGTEGVDRDALLGQAAELLRQQPRTRAELGTLLAERWPNADPGALAYAATHHIGTFLVDGTWQGTWQIRSQTLRIQPFTMPRRADLDALLAEAAQLCAFVAAQAKYDVIVDKP